MKKIIECVPNFSEGQNETVINAIAQAIGSTTGVTLLDVDPGKSTNRTVYTFVAMKKALLKVPLPGPGRPGRIQHVPGHRKSQ